MDLNAGPELQGIQTGANRWWGNYKKAKKTHVLEKRKDARLSGESSRGSRLKDDFSRAEGNTESLCIEIRSICSKHTVPI